MITVSRLLSRRYLLASSAAALAGCSRPRATSFPGYCFVANRGSRSVSAIDLRRFRVRRQIPLDAEPGQVVPHPTAPNVFVLAPGAGTVYEVQAASLGVSRRAKAGNQAVGMQLSPRKNALWILYRDPAALVELPLDSFKPGRHISLDAPPSAFDLTDAGNEQRRAAIAADDGRIVLVSLDSGAVERAIAGGGPASLMRFRMDGKSLVVGHRDDRSLSIFDVSTGKTVVRLPLAVEPRHLCVNSDGGQMFISGPGMDAVVIVFPYSTEIWQTVLAGRAPGAMAVTETPPFLMVANPDTDSLTVLDVSTQKLVAVVQVGRQPGQVLLTPDQQYALVLNELSGDLAVIRTYSLRAPQLSVKARFKSAPVFTMIPVGEQPVSAAVVTLV